MAKFKSEFKGLLLEDEKGVWARFVDGEFETTDKDVVARLRKAEHVDEVKASAKAED